MNALTSIRSLPYQEKVALRGRTEPWGFWGSVALAVLFAVALWLRARGLSAEGFGDDEVHKWLAARRYLSFDFGGDDLEHPMLMKSLIALCLWATRGALSPEAVTRLPNVVAGAAGVTALALLGRRLFGRATGLVAAALSAVSPWLVGYQRVAKEDTLLGLFLVLCLWCLAEAKAAADSASPEQARRWETFGAMSLGAMMASKYFLFLALIPFVAYALLRRTGTSFVVAGRRWVRLGLVALASFAVLDFTPLLPSSWFYLHDHLAGSHVTTPTLYFAGHLYSNLPLEVTGAGVPLWFYGEFVLAKLTPPVLGAALVGLCVSLWQRRPAHLIVLTWVGIWTLFFGTMGAKYGRFTLSLAPGLVLLAAYGLVLAAAALTGLFSARGRALARAGRLGMRRAAPALVVLVAAVPFASEASASLEFFPHYRMYLSPLVGGEAQAAYLFPHCDDFDAGFREAVRAVAARAEVGAELATEIDWPARLYAERFGRPDLTATLLRPGEACRAGVPCYVVVQEGRLYSHNWDVVANLARRAPWHVEKIRGRDVVKVYRLEPSETPFPELGPSAHAAR